MGEFLQELKCGFEIMTYESQTPFVTHNGDQCANHSAMINSLKWIGTAKWNNIQPPTVNWPEREVSQLGCLHMALAYRYHFVQVHGLYKEGFQLLVSFQCGRIS